MRDLTRGSLENQSEFWALAEVSFDLDRGRALGIIGQNGAGKTTLLRMLAGQLPPDSGEIRIHGQAEAMIDLTAGFNMGATGRENIYIRGSLIGRTYSEIQGSEREIIEFAELQDAIDAPVSTYSAGMLMRLAFAIVVASAPDLLIIDEVLAVGDFRFRQKCLRRIRELRQHSAFVFVSHSMGDIRNFCDTVLVLHRGRVVFAGPPDEAIEHYESIDDSGSVETPFERVLKPQYLDDDSVVITEHRWTDSDGNAIDEVNFGDPIRLEVELKLSRKLEQPIIGVPVWASSGEYVTGFSTQITKSQICINEMETHQLVLEVPECLLNPGEYYSNLSLSDGPEFVYRMANPILRVNSTGAPFWGAVTLPHHWSQKF